MPIRWQMDTFTIARPNLAKNGTQDAKLVSSDMTKGRYVTTCRLGVIATERQLS